MKEAPTTEMNKFGDSQIHPGIPKQQVLSNRTDKHTAQN
jgi:hypothetical protein